MRTLLLFAIAATVVMAGCGKGDDGTQSVQLINGSKHKQMLYHFMQQMRGVSQSKEPHEMKPNGSPSTSGREKPVIAKSS